MKPCLKYAVPLFLLALGLAACTDDDDSVSVFETPAADLVKISAKNFEVKSVDSSECLVEVFLGAKKEPVFVFDKFELSSGTAFLAANGDLVDPEVDWESPVKSGVEVSLADTANFSFVILDELDRIAKVCLVEWDKPTSSSSEGSSSSSEKASSSSEKPKEPKSSSSSEKSGKESSSSEAKSSSSSEKASSSSEKPEEPESSSSSEKSGKESSSSEAESSSSSEKSSSSSETPEEPESSSSLGAQLPGSDFTALDAGVWATPSAALSVNASGTYRYKTLLVFNTDETVSISSQANATFEDGKLKLTTVDVMGRGKEFGTVSKAAGGFYFAGAFTGTNARSIFNASGSEYENVDASDFSGMFTHGVEFTDRPKAFKIKYAYEHVADSSENYPQKCLVYVMLVSADGKVVALGSLMDASSVAMTEKTVELSYGSDPDGLLSGGFPVAAGLELGDGTEDVAFIHVMFASSAYAFVADVKARGAVGAALTVDEFELVY